jgi:hypothetical protein
VFLLCLLPAHLSQISLLVRCDRLMESWWWSRVGTPEDKLMHWRDEKEGLRSTEALEEQQMPPLSLHLTPGVELCDVSELPLPKASPCHQMSQCSKFHHYGFNF